MPVKSEYKKHYTRMRHAFDEMTTDEKLYYVKSQRDRRDQDGPPESLEEALACILQQDEDIKDLIKIIEAMTAKLL